MLKAVPPAEKYVPRPLEDVLFDFRQCSGNWQTYFRIFPCDTLIRHYAGWIDQATREHERRLVDSFQTTVAALSTPQIGKVEGKGEGRPGMRRQVSVESRAAVAF
ncbi:MAG TPA: hypothetical protein V6D08_06280 [Candidatus Obscuribacterales bacterium]